MRKSTKFAAVVVAVAGATMAMSGVYATSLALSANQDAGGSVAVSQCDTDGMTMQTAAPVFNETITPHTDVIPTFVISDIDTDCVGATLYVTSDNVKDSKGVVLSWHGVIPESGAVIDPVNSTTNVTGAVFTVPSEATDGSMEFTFATGAMPLSFLDNWVIAIHDSAPAGVSGI